MTSSTATPCKALTSWPASISTSDADALFAFIEQHENGDSDAIMLQSKTDLAIRSRIAEHLAARRIVRDKIPAWYASRRLLFPGRTAAEQCSSEWTAIYKQRLIAQNSHVCDLTGGMGVDSYFLSLKAARLTYIERNSEYAGFARYNFHVLGANNINVVEGEAAGCLESLPPVDVFYIDPARRNASGKRIYAIEDCEPNLVDLLPALFERAPTVIAKLSPMADLSRSLTLLPSAKEVHVVSVRNECKELLFVLDRDAGAENLLIHCVNKTVDSIDSFVFDLAEERNASLSFATELQTYLYEPNSSILKAGAFKSIARTGINKLHPNSHLYTSDAYQPDFPGRIFKIDELMPFSSSLLRKLGNKVPRASITVRNFPLAADELRRRTRIADGGNVYLIATTVASGARIVALCSKMR